ncbi:MAG: hypothetical protein ACLQT5_10035 [Steroidobacteraceae bacterium]|jgi:hypothetical protein
MQDEKTEHLAAWPPLSEGIGVALWTSFIAACLETAVVFACFDPLTLGLDDYFAPALLALRPMIYAFGFFVFWLFTFVGTALTAYMLSLSGARR